MDIVILPPYLQLVRNEVAQLPPENELHIPQGLLEHLPELILYFHCLLIDFFDLFVDDSQQLLELIFPFLKVGVHFINFGGNKPKIVRNLFKFMSGHGTLRMTAINLTTNAHGLIARTAEQLIFGLLMVATKAKV